MSLGSCSFVPPLSPRADRRVVASGSRRLSADARARPGAARGRDASVDAVRRLGGGGRPGRLGRAHRGQRLDPAGPGGALRRRCRRRATRGRRGRGRGDGDAGDCTPRSSRGRRTTERRAGGAHRPLRAELRQRVLERHAAGLRRRRRQDLRPVHQAGRRARPRVHARGHRSSPPGSVYQGQSGALNESVSDVFGACVKQRALGQTADRGRLAGRRGHLPARRPGPRAARHGPSRHGVRRPDARQGPAGRPTWPTTSTPPTTTAASTSTPASPTAPSTSPRRRSAATPGRAPARSGTPR